MLLNLLSEAAEGTTNTTQNNGSGSNWIIWVIFGVMIVGMILLTVIPNKRRQKEYQKMQNEIRVGTKIMTIGRMVGTITKVYTDGTIELDVGTPGNPVVITITREAIGVNMTAQEQAKAAQEAAKKNGSAKKTEVAAPVENAETVSDDENTETVANAEAEIVDTNSSEDDAI